MMLNCTSVSLQQCNDVGLMAYLGTITKSCNSMNQFINKFNVLYDRQGIGRRMRGLFFWAGSQSKQRHKQALQFISLICLFGCLYFGQLGHILKPTVAFQTSFNHKCIQKHLIVNLNRERDRCTRVGSLWGLHSNQSTAHEHYIIWHVCFIVYVSVCNKWSAGFFFSWDFESHCF